LDNLTHALVGAAVAELALSANETRRTRRLFLGAAVLASNLPDLDLVYTGVTPAPLGYLLHHRGHTHTVAGLVAQGIAIAALCFAPPLRRAVRAAGTMRFAALITVCLALHVILDSWNTYGVHPFWPADSRWFYGDAVFIFEPWLWLFLGIAAAANATTRGRTTAVAALLTILFLALLATGILPLAALVMLLVAAAVLARVALSLTPRQRAAGALASCAVFVTLMFGLSSLARGHVRAAGGNDGRAIVDIVVNPNPGWPACWDVIAIERDAAELVFRRGTLSLVPGRVLPEDCPSHRLEKRARASTFAPLVWHGETRQAIGVLRDLAARDCWVRGWLQFGRAPFVRDGTIADLRFQSGVRGNFTAMGVGGNRSCPDALTHWVPPRADVLETADD
jgi:inner membrane protein